MSDLRVIRHIERPGYMREFGMLPVMMFLPESHVRRALGQFWHYLCQSMHIYFAYGCNGEADKMCIHTNSGPFNLTLDEYRLSSRVGVVGLIAKYKSDRTIPAGTVINAITAHPIGYYSGACYALTPVLIDVPVRFTISRSTNTLVFISTITYNKALSQFEVEIF